ncbi:Bug family tripartite tricarboxylate transporter substrate binding protein [Achromobacter deleyi]|uniref:Bug family tripartite tricarboxylate transporter substrate binding protein n=1 Tax=Achromobacter deleyi TaxID=1353891 RepID=UPI001491A688|nr:tripartite tricarboxylate transporter substrate binding protein [Achromobacter deleyi]QVQ28850.1 tripartite tricarboxylate transporter substrate binding protein [Achromobacter deleyi]UIP18966.1 tripartite tricarboxylate transporter substrate binding protein [Achromobacter deleyi]
MKTTTLKLALAGLAWACAAAPAHAQGSYPSQPIRIIVGYSAGGTTDILARALGEQLSKELKQPIIIENKAGAAGNIAAAAVQQAAPDGYTLFMATVSSHGINPAVYRKSLGYDPVGGFTPVSMIASIPLVLVANPKLPVKSVADLVELARAKPGDLNYSSSGNGSPVHVAGAMFASEAHVTIQHVPYRGGALANSSVMSGETQFSFATLPAALPQVKAGSLRALAVTTRERSTELPDVPTVAETTSFKGYEINTWNALMAPKGTPDAVVDVLNKAVARALAMPALQTRFKGEGATPGASSPAELGQFVNAELARWATVIKEVNIQIE